jgi:hypothetical protein
MPSPERDLADLARRARDTYEEARGDFAKAFAPRNRASLEELNPPVAPPRPPPWDAFWLRRERLWVWFFASLLGGPLAGAMVMVFSRSLGMAIALTGISGFLVSGYLLGSVPCPRCGRRFDTIVTPRGRYSNGFTCRCLYCGLRRGMYS